MRREKKSNQRRRRESCLHLTAALLVILLLQSGCGYRFSGDTTSAYPAIKSVFVDIFTNKTSEANAESIFRTAFSNHIVQAGHFRLTATREEADAVFRGAVGNLQSAPLAYKSTSLAAENRVTVILELFLVETASGRTLWSNDAFIGTVDYPVTDVGITETSRKNALVKLATDSAEKVYRLMMSDF
jgi:hypothetical protein